MRKISIVITIVFLVILGLIGYLQFDGSKAKVKELFRENNLKYHFVLIVESSVESFSNEIISGVEDAAKEFNFAVEIHKPGKTNTKEEINKRFDMAIESKVDGILLSAPKNEELDFLANKSIDNKIPVVSIETDFGMSSRISSMNSNSFEVGKRIGQYLLNHGYKKVKMAVVFSENAEEKYRNVLTSGLRYVFENRGKIEIITSINSKNGILDAEDATSNMLKKAPDINVILCTTLDITIGTRQQLLNLNKTKEIAVVGYDISPEVIEDIKDGSLLASVYRDPYKIGYESAKKIYAVKEGKELPAYKELSVEILDSNNLHQYIFERQGQKYGK